MSDKFPLVLIGVILIGEVIYVIRKLGVVDIEISFRVNEPGKERLFGQAAIPAALQIEFQLCILHRLDERHLRVKILIIFIDCGVLIAVCGVKIDRRISVLDRIFDALGELVHVQQVAFCLRLENEPVLCFYDLRICRSGHFSAHSLQCVQGIVEL